MEDSSALLRRLSENNHQLLYRCRRSAADAEAIVPALVELLSAPSDAVVAEALRALHRIGPAAVAAAEAVVGLLSHSDWIVRANAVSTLGLICLERPGLAVDHLAGAADHPDLLRPVLFALIEFREHALPAVQVYCRAYRHREASIRRLAIRGLIAAKAQDPASLEVLRLADADPSKEVRAAAARRRTVV